MRNFQLPFAFSIPAAFCACALAAAPAPEPPPAAPFSDQLFFGGKDHVHGRFLAFADGALDWQSPDVALPIPFKTANLDRVEFVKVALPEHGDDIRIAFNNGDALVGKSVAYAPGRTVVETWYAGRLAFRSDAIRGFAPVREEAPALLVRGFGKRGDWQTFTGEAGAAVLAGGKLKFVNGRTGVAKKMELPDRFQLSLALEMRDNGMAIIDILGDEPNDGGNSYRVQMSRWGQTLTREEPNGSQPLGVSRLRLSTKTNLVFCVDAKAKTLACFADGRPIGRVHDADQFRKGKHLIIAGQGLQIADLVLAAWDGKSPPAGGKSAFAWAAKPSESDHVVLDDGDEISGDLLSINQGKAVLKTEYATLDIPLGRVLRIELSKRSNHAQAAAGDDAQFCFDEDAHLTLRLRAIKNGQALAASETLGECTLDMRAAQALAFNLDARFRAEEAERAKEKEEDAEAAADGSENAPDADVMVGNN